MKQRDNVKIPAREEVRVVSVSCDFCNKDIPIIRNNYEINEVVMGHNVGDSYPGGGSGARTGVDMCPECFAEKFIPWVESQGIKPFGEEWDW